MGCEDTVRNRHDTAGPNVERTPEAPDTSAQRRGRGKVPVWCPDVERACEKTAARGCGRTEDKVEERGGDEKGADRRVGEVR